MKDQISLKIFQPDFKNLLASLGEGDVLICLSPRLIPGVDNEELVLVDHFELKKEKDLPAVIGLDERAFLVEIILASREIIKAGWRGISFYFYKLISHSPPWPNRIKIFLPPEKNLERAVGIIITTTGEIFPLKRIKIVGPEMVVFNLTSSSLLSSQIPLTPIRAALGGIAVWERLTSLSFSLVGVGKTGSLAAIYLARTGVKQINLIDPDFLQYHNLEGMLGVFPEEIGHLKVKILKEHLLKINPSLQINALPFSNFSQKSLDRLTKCDIILSCVDNDAARIMNATIARSLGQPLLDIGTGVFKSQGRIEMGAEVRLILPGDGCLFCWGAVRDLKDSVNQLEQIVRSGYLKTDRPWFQDRLGSLLSLNGVAVNLGLCLVEELIRGKITRSQWLRIEYQTSTPVIRTMNKIYPNCPVCRQKGKNEKYF